MTQRLSTAPAEPLDLVPAVLLIKVVVTRAPVNPDHLRNELLPNGR
jgi:hypothetical protein